MYIRRNTFYCFSPPVMVATFTIETMLLAATFVRYRMNTAARLASAILGFLALFQLSEYFVCGGLGVDAMVWSRIGYIAITTLPALGLHLIYSVAKRKNYWSVWLGYALSMFWIILFGFSEAAFMGHQCTGNYVIFQLRPGVGGMYFVYYYVLLFWGILAALRSARSQKNRKTKEALYGMCLGYIVFLLPTTIVNTLSPSTLVGIPSIMCGFAILYAFILFGFVLPRASRSK